MRTRCVHALATSSRMKQLYLCIPAQHQYRSFTIFYLYSLSMLPSILEGPVLNQTLSQHAALLVFLP
jgi:hypothetical protein